jgi:hypothetical protein
MAVMLRGSDTRGPQPDVTVEILAADRVSAREILAEIRRLVVEYSVYRGQVLSFGSEVLGHQGVLLTFNKRPEMSRDELVLPPGMLEGIERQILSVAEHRDVLLAHGQHLKRGVLLYGPPGTGKTHTVRYLMSRLPETTVVVLSSTALASGKEPLRVTDTHLTEALDDLFDSRHLLTRRLLGAPSDGARRLTGEVGRE